MATKQARAGRAKKAKRRDQDGQEDLTILHPNQTIPVAGEKVTVREYGFVEGLKLRATAAPFIDGLQDLYANGAGGSTTPLEVIFDLIGLHYEAILEMVAVSTDKPVEWVHDLSAADGELVLLTWWGVNGPFFQRTLMRRRMMQLSLQGNQSAKEADGETSTQPSSPQDTTQTGSAHTQNDS